MGRYGRWLFHPSHPAGIGPADHGKTISSHADVHQGNRVDIPLQAPCMGTRKLSPGRRQRRDKSLARLIGQSHSPGNVPARHAQRVRRQQQCAERQFHISVGNRASDFSFGTTVCRYPGYVNRPAPTTMDSLCAAVLFRRVAAARDSYSGLAGGSRFQQRNCSAVRTFHLCSPTTGRLQPAR